QGILDSAEKEKGVVAGRPFPMITDEKTGLLCFFGTEGGAGLPLVVVLDNVARVGIEITDLEKDDVFIRQLPLETPVHRCLFQVIVLAKATLAPVEPVDGIAEIAQNAV